MAIGSILGNVHGLHETVFFNSKTNFMGRFRKGILGGFSGTVGTVVGGTWRGIDVMRSRPTPSKSPLTLAQEIHRAKFKMATQFIKDLKDVLAVAYREYSGNMTGSNSALSYTMKNAISGVYPNLSINYSQVIVARGNLTAPSGAVASAVDQGIVGFSWLDNSGQGSARATDKAIFVCYSPELKQVIYSLHGSVRSARQAEYNVPAFGGKQVHTWIAFISENGKEVSGSVYCGAIQVP